MLHEVCVQALLALEVCDQPLGNQFQRAVQQARTNMQQKTSRPKVRKYIGREQTSAGNCAYAQACRLDVLQVLRAHSRTSYIILYGLIAGGLSI